MHSRLAYEIRRYRSIRHLTIAALAAGFAAAAMAQADGDSNAMPVPVVIQAAPTDSSQPARIAPVDAPGGALMNNLQDRMKQIQATQDPTLRQRRMDEFLKTLNSGMHSIAKNGAAAGR